MSLSGTQSTPSQDEIRTIKEDITSLEIEMEHALKLLDEAQCRVDSLAKALFEKKSLIAPVKNATFDILSMIFEASAIEDWKSALRISGVCREWRNVIIQVPRAWIYIDHRECIHKCAELYAERSGWHRLHMRAVDYPTERIFANISDKICCMEVSVLSEESEKSNFSNLERLRIPWNDWSVSVFSIATWSFPSLRHLWIYNTIQGTFDQFTFPPLETLGIYIDENGAALDILQACSKSLKSLDIRVDFSYGTRLDPVEFTLPQLQYLCINDDYYETSNWLELSAPNLSTYIVKHQGEGYENTLQSVIDSITHLRLHRSPPPASSFKRLRVAQFDVSLRELCCFLDELVTQDPASSHLEHIEFRGTYLNPSGISNARLHIDSFNKQNGLQPPRPILLNEDWCQELPGENQGPVCNFLSNTPLC